VNEDGFLYHYTDVDALTKIITKKTMRATHIRYLNDTSEQTILRDAVLARIERDIDRVDTKERWKARLSRELESIFVTCFSEDRGDRLSQWRAYGRDSGVCLKFDKSMLTRYCEEKEDIESIALEKVKYVRPDMSGPAAESIMKEILETLESSSRSYVPRDLARTGATIKHSAFQEESEWRLLLPKNSVLGIDTVEYRVRGSLLVPYFDRDFKGFLTQVLSAVIVGPILHKEQTAEAIKGLLKENGFASTDVRCSQTPYRGF
jgi:hypothetical protein